MVGFPQFERLSWFHKRVKQKLYPNATHIMERFEVSRKTAQRDITLLRDRMCAPLAYHPAHKGHFYTEEDFEFPRLLATQEDILVMVVTLGMLSSAGRFISEAFRGLMQEFKYAAASLGLDGKRLEERFSASWPGYSPAPERVFQAVARALVECRTMEIDYQSPGANASTRRIIEPHHLQHYMGSWVLIAYCRLRRDWRKFYLARISQAELLRETFTFRPREQWVHQLKGAFGIFQGNSSTLVTLRFNPFRSRWVREQVWHPAQTVRTMANGGIELTFPVADFREVKMKILQFGADVQVLAPDSLREELREEVERLQALYHPGKTPGL